MNDIFKPRFACSIPARAFAAALFALAMIAGAAAIVCSTGANAYAEIASPGEYTLVSYQTQNLSLLENEQISASVVGQTLTVEGKTKAEASDSLSSYYVGMTFEVADGGTKVTSGMNATCTDSVDPSDGRAVHSFKLTKNLSTVDPGIYRVNVFAPNAQYNYKGGMITRNIYLRVAEDGTCGILQYDDVVAENSGVSEGLRASAFASSKYLDTSLSDMSFVLTSESGTASSLTSSQQSALARFAGRIIQSAYPSVADAASLSDIQKVRAIYEFAAKNIYYDTNRVGKTHNNPYYTVLHIMSDTASTGYNYDNGRVACECTGYAATVISLCRSIGIPARLVNGMHTDTKHWDAFMGPESGKTPPSALDSGSTNHHWAEVYVQTATGGQWVTVDANAGSPRTYKANDGSWNNADQSINYTFFCCTPQQLAVNYIERGPYMQLPATATFQSSTASTIKVNYSIDCARSGVHVKVCDASDSSVVVGEASTTNATACTVTGLPGGRDYKVYVCGYALLNGQKVDGPAYRVSAYTTPAVPSITAITPTATSAKVTWKPVNGNGYETRIALNSTFTKESKLSKSTSGTAKSCSFTSLRKGTTYYVKIRSYSKYASGTVRYSAWSAAKKISTAPAKVTIKAPTTGSKYVKANWSYTSTAKGYQVQVATDSKFTKDLKSAIATGTKTTTKKMSSLKKGKKYYVRVRAYTTPTNSSAKVYGAWSATKYITCK